MARRLAVRQNVVPLSKPCARLALEHRFPARRGETFAVNHSHATPAAGARPGKEVGESNARFARRQPMQIDLALDDPVSASQLRQDVGADPPTNKGLTAFEFLADVP